MNIPALYQRLRLAWQVLIISPEHLKMLDDGFNYEIQQRKAGKTQDLPTTAKPITKDCAKPTSAAGTPNETTL